MNFRTADVKDKDIIGYLRVDLARHKTRIAELEAQVAKLTDADETWHGAYDRITGLLRKRFPIRPDGSHPDWAIEDVLEENAKLQAVENVARAISDARYQQAILRTGSGPSLGMWVSLRAALEAV